MCSGEDRACGVENGCREGAAGRAGRGVDGGVLLGP